MADTAFDVVVIGGGPGRLHRGDPRRAARASRGLHRRLESRRRQAGAGRHLHQRRLHPVQGAAAVVRELRARRTRLRRPRHRGQGTLARRRADARAQGQGRRAEQRRHPAPVQEEQGRVLPRPRLVRRAAQRDAGWPVAVAGTAAATLTAAHVIVATGLEAARAARGRDRQPAGARQRRARWRCPRCRSAWGSSARASSASRWAACGAAWARR